MSDPEVNPPVGELIPAGDLKAELSLPKFNLDNIDTVLKLLGAMPGKLEPVLKRIIASKRMPAKLKEIATELEAVLELFQLLSDVLGIPLSELLDDLFGSPTT